MNRIVFAVLSRMTNPAFIPGLKLVAVIALLSGGVAARADVTTDIPASANAFVLRSAATTDQNEAQEIAAKRPNDSNTRIAYVRFNLSSFLSTNSVDDIIGVSLRMELRNAVTDTMRVYGLLDSVGGTNGFDALWTGVMTWNNQPCGLLPNSATALPNTNTTALIGSQAFTSTLEPKTITLTLADFKSFLNNDSNGEVTLVLTTVSSTTQANWASRDNTGGYLVPTLRLIVLGEPPTQADIVWRGTNSNFGVSGEWDFFSSNWRSNNAQTLYSDGLIVGFDDTAAVSAINLNTTVSPGGILISNNAVNFSLNGSGVLSGAGGLFKYGNGTFVLDNTGLNDFSGSVVVEQGTLKIGNDDFGGSLGSGTVVNNGTIAFSRIDDVTVANAIQGSGSIEKTTNGMLTLSGASSYTGPTTVSAGTLRVNNNSALGATNGGTVIAHGATLDVGAPSAAVNTVSLFESITVGGAGITDQGAIVNNSTVSQLNALRFVTLTTNTVFGGLNRWDIRSEPVTSTNAWLLTGGQPYRLIKTGVNHVGLVGVKMDPAFGDIDVQQGIFALERGTTVGNSASNLTVQSGATLLLFQLFNGLDKQLNLIGSGASDTVFAADGTVDQNFIIGPMTLTADCWMGVNTADFMTFSNNIGGTGTLTKTGAGTLTLAGTAAHGGGTVVLAGTLVLNGAHSTTLSVQSGTTLRGTGTNTGSTEISGALRPGAIGGAGTLTSGPLTFTGFGDVTFDLTNSATIGGGVNDLIQVNGDLTANFDTININVLGGLQTTTPYRLINYSGNLLGAGFNSSITPVGRYVFTLNTGTPNQVNLSVVGGPVSLRWISTIDNTWSDLGAFNWTTNTAGSTPADQFYNTDRVTFDDTPGVVTNIAITGIVVPASITNNSSANHFSMTGAGSIAGSTALVKSGSSTLTLGTSNTFTGEITVQSGVLRLNHSSALGSTNGATVIHSGATFDVGGPSFAANAANVGLEPIRVTGAGVGGEGAIVNKSAVTQINALRNVTMTGDTVFGGTNRWDIRSAPSSTTNSLLSSQGQPRKLSKVGPNQISLVGTVVDPELGDIDIEAGILSVETGATSLGRSASNLFVRAGATFQVFQSSMMLNKQFKLFGSGTNNTINAADGTVAQNIFVGPMDLNGDCWMSVNTSDFMTFSNTLSGTGSLTKLGAGTLRMAGNNNYSGNTSISNGILALVGSTTLANSSTVTVGAGATLDVNEAGGTLTLVSGQTLQGNGTVAGILTAANNSTVAPGQSVGRLSASSVINLSPGSACRMELDASAGTNDVLSSSSAILYGGTLSVTNIAGTLAAGQSYKLFNAPLLTQDFAVTNLPPLGAGLAWEWTPATGTLSIVATGPSASPAITQIQLSGGNVILRGTNNAGPGGTYQILTSTNVTLSVSNWTVLTNGTFDGSGNFAVTNVVTPEPRRFYMMQVP